MSEQHEWLDERGCPLRDWGYQYACGCCFHMFRGGGWANTPCGQESCIGLWGVAHPWLAAKAVEVGLRAIAGWPGLPAFYGIDRHPVQRLAGLRVTQGAIERAWAKAKRDWESAHPLASEQLIPVPPGAFERVKDAEIEAANAQPIPSRWGNPVRPRCYHCGKKVPCSEHPNQPPPA